MRSYFNKNEPMTSEHFFPHFLSGLVLIWTKSEDKNVQLVRGQFVPRCACGFQNLVGTSVYGEHNLSPLVRIGFKWLPKLGAMCHVHGLRTPNEGILSKISEKLGRCGRQNMLRLDLKIWEWE